MNMMTANLLMMFKMTILFSVRPKTSLHFPKIYTGDTKLETDCKYKFIKYRPNLSMSSLHSSHEFGLRHADSDLVIQVRSNFDGTKIFIDNQVIECNDYNHLANEPFVFMHEPREWTIRLGNTGKPAFAYTLSINDVNFSDMPEGPAPQRAALARAPMAKSNTSMEGREKSGMFPLLRNG